MSQELLSHIRRLFRYDRWANHEALASVENGASPRAVKLFAHIIAAEHLWLDRIQKCSAKYPVWPQWSVEESRARMDEAAARWKEFVDGLTLAGLQAEVSYKNSKGEPWINNVLDIALHVLMHSAYHRGQIAAEVRASGGEPAYTDFIEGVRRNRIG